MLTTVLCWVFPWHSCGCYLICTTHLNSARTLIVRQCTPPPQKHSSNVTKRPGSQTPHMSIWLSTRVMHWNKSDQWRAPPRNPQHPRIRRQRPWCQTPRDPPRGPVSIPQWVRAALRYEGVLHNIRQGVLMLWLTDSPTPPDSHASWIDQQSDPKKCTGKWIMHARSIQDRPIAHIIAKSYIYNLYQT